MINILYIDSNREVFEKTKTQLAEIDPTYKVSWAGSAVPAQMILEKSRFDLVVSSYLLSDLDGISLLQRLRQAGNKIPYILISQQDSDEVKAKAADAGASDCIFRSKIQKDITPLDASIKEVLEEQKQAAGSVDVQNLRQQAAFFNINPAPVMQAKYNGTIINHNIAAREIFNEELKGRLLTDVFKGLNLYDIKIIANYGVSQLEQTIGEDSFLFTFRADVESKTLYVFGSNITDRIIAEGELRSAHNQNEILLASISSILISVDRNGYIQQWNTVAEKVFGSNFEENIGKKFAECGINWRQEEFIRKIPVFQRIKTPLQIPSVRFRKPDGNDSFLAVNISPIKSGGFLLLADDITERKVLEDQLSQAQKLEAIGQLAAGIAHEINTPTQYIGDNTHFVHDAFTDVLELMKGVQNLIAVHKQGGDTASIISQLELAAEDADIEYLMEEVPSAIDQSLEGIKRVTNIVKAMKEFSHPGSEEKTNLNLNKAIESTITVARNEWKYVADMETDLDPNLPSIPCYPGELNQVFLNIITNAAHAIGDVVGDGSQGKGKITITTKLEGNWVIVTIGDSGKGIPEKIRKKIFEPFFTTKEVGKGTGQGLAISHTVIVEKHQGRLNFESEPGKGTTFIIHLPVEPGHQEEAAV